MTPRPLIRRLVAVQVATAVVAGAFVAGALTSGSAAPGSSARPTGPDRLDEAARRIADGGLHPVDRDALDAAAISAMLRAADDTYGRWQPGSAGSAGVGLPLPAPVSTRRLPGGGTVLAVPTFVRGTGRQVRAALGALPAVSRGVVLDLRGNGGGLLAEAVETASAFLDGGLVVRATRRDGSVQELDAVGAGDLHTPLVVLVDGGSASASEVVAGALLDRGRAVVVGSRTYGKGTVQEPTTLSDGSRLELTVATWRTPSGHDVEGIGLEPDIEVAPTRNPAVALRRAADVLPGLLASVPSGAR